MNEDPETDPRNAVTIGVLRALLATATLVTGSFAMLEFYVGYVRTYPAPAGSLGDFTDGPVILWYGVAFAFFALCWGMGALGVGPKARWGWGWGLSLVGSIAAVAHGLYRLQQSPPFGIVRTSAGLQALGAWVTTILGALLLAYMLVLFGLAVRREYRAGHIL